METARRDGTFCDEKTFTVINRDFPGTEASVSEAGGARVITTPGYRILISTAAEDSAKMLESIRILDPQSGEELWNWGQRPRWFALPGPERTGQTWSFADQPRAIPPPWGALPPPADAAEGMPREAVRRSGWRIDTEVRDRYVFLHRGDLNALIKDFLKLTGPIPMIPRWALGFWVSRYHPYSEQSALALIDIYRERDIPLDVFVIDTDWRVGSSRGYEINTELFPDMRRFFDEAHRRGIRILFNDHPEPRGEDTLAPSLLRYRYDNLTRLLDMGLDGWWFDRNWTDIIPGPARGIETAVWGEYLYFDIIRSFRKKTRAAVLSMRPFHPAGHRFPVHWTGDIPSEWDALRQAVRQTLEDGTQLLPWTGQDLGGHVGFPSPEQYVRWLQWGSMSPIMRIHCSSGGRRREPWLYGKEALDIARRYIALRYRLMPLLYAAARRAHDEGRPLLRKLDYEWSAHPDAKRADQFMLGEDLLVAPLLDSKNETERHGSPVEPEEGFYQEVFEGDSMQQPPLECGHVPSIMLSDINSQAARMAWGSRFTARWSGHFLPAEDGWYQFMLTGTGSNRLYLCRDDPPDISERLASGLHSSTRYLKKGKPWPIQVIHHQTSSEIHCRLSFRRLPDPSALQPSGREVWIPPGVWHDLWSGRELAGPRLVHVTAGLEQMPLYVRAGAIIPLAPPAAHTGKPWNPLTLDLYPPHADTACARILYEDDGISDRYIEASCRRTPLVIERSGKNLLLTIGPGQGTHDGVLKQRDWIARFHLPREEKPGQITVDGKQLPGPVADTYSTLAWRIIPPRGEDEEPSVPLAGPGSAPPGSAGCVVEVYLPSRDAAHLCLQSQ